MPACEVTSVNSIGPDGRGGVGLALGEGDGVTAASVCCAVMGASVFLQDVRIEIVAMNISARIIRIRELKTPGLLSTNSFILFRFPPNLDQIRCGSHDKQRIERCVHHLH